MENPSNVNGWLLLQSRPQREFTIRDHLQRARLEPYVPAILKSVRINRHRREFRPRPLLPCYLFLRRFEHSGGWQAVHTAPGIAKLFTIGNKLFELPNEIIEEIRLRELDEARHRRRRRRTHIKPGMLVQITAGAWTGIIMRVEKVDRRGTLDLQLAQSSRQTSIRISVSGEQVRAI